MGMCSHWLDTPVNGYLGSRYGSDKKSLLQTPQAAGLAESFIAKCRQDVPILTTASEGAIALYAEPAGIDELNIILRVLDQDIAVEGSGFSADRGGDAVYSTEPELIDTVNLSGAQLLHQYTHVTLPTYEQF